MFDSLRHAYPNCPMCRDGMDTRDEGGIVRPVCPGCGFVQYLNPAPAAAAVIRCGGRICLVRRKYPPRAGQWTLPAGFLEYDESPAEAVVREVLEETGLQTRIVGLRSVHQGVLPPDRPVILVVYDCRQIGGELLAGDDAAEVGFYSLDDFPGPIAFATHRDVLAALAEEDA